MVQIDYGRPSKGYQHPHTKVDFDSEKRCEALVARIRGFSGLMWRNEESVNFPVFPLNLRVLN